MHPAAILILWLIAVCLLQFYAPTALLGFGVVLLFMRTGLRWWRLMARARWLLFSLWVIMAYSLPGTALFDRPWMPTWEGVESANLHALRLILMLGYLAALMKSLNHNDLLLAIAVLLRPFGRHADRLVVRLALVLEYAEQPAIRGMWRELLQDSFSQTAQKDRIILPVIPWKLTDAAKLSLFSLLLLAVLAL